VKKWQDSSVIENGVGQGGWVRGEYHRRKILLSGIGNKCMLASIKSARAPIS